MVKKEQMKKPVRTGGKKAMKKMNKSLKKNKLEASIKAKSIKLEKAGKKGASTIQGKVKRKIAKKKMKKFMKNARKMSTKKVKKAAKKLKQKGKIEHVTNINKMMKALPRGKGLVKAFQKIEAEKKKPNKNFLKGVGRKKFARQVKKMEGKKPDVSALTKVARMAVRKTARNKS